MKATKIISLLIALAIVFNLSGCSGDKTVKLENNEIINNLFVADNRTIIAKNKTAVLSQYAMGVSSGAPPGGTYISSDLKEIMSEYEGQDVWFRVFFEFTNLYGMYALYDETREKYIDYNDFRATFIESEINYAKEIGALNIVREMSSDAPKKYAMEVTADMINKIFERGNMSFDIAHPARIEGYSKKISDTLTDRLSKMSDTDTLEIAAVMVYDDLNSYALRQDIGANSAYGDYIKFYQGVNETFAECDALLEQTVVDILKRNNILEKRVVSDALPQIGLDAKNNPNSTATSYVLEDIPVGFNAVLTKTEILKLAEDEEIKVIYLAGQN